MLVHLQFQIRVDGGTALAWPHEKRGNLLSLTHEPLLSSGYGSEALAIADLDRWTDRFACIIEAETVLLGDENAPQF